MAVALRKLDDSRVIGGGNVVDFANDPTCVDIAEIYESWLSISRRNSKKTEKEYNRRAKEFFEMVLGKGVGFISKDDILGIKAKDVQLKYIDKLMKRNSNNTISVKLNSLKSLWGEFKKNGVEVDGIIFKTKLDKSGVKHHQALTEEQLQELYNFFLNEERQKGLEKYLLTKFLVTTGIRITASISIKWEDIEYIEGDIYVVNTLDKGNKYTDTPIAGDLYEELKQMDNGTEKVFNINDRTLERGLKRFGEKIGREITIHSLKATGVVRAYRMSGNDIEATRKFAKHESYDTTMLYLDNEQDYSEYLSYTMSKKVDIDIVDKMTGEELLNFLNDNQDIKRQIAMRLGR